MLKPVCCFLLLLQDMRVDTLVQIQYDMPLNQNGVDNAEDACREAERRLLREMERVFARQEINMVCACGGTRACQPGHSEGSSPPVETPGLLPASNWVILHTFPWFTN